MPRYDAMMVCPQCGKRYPADTEVCQTDGTRLSSLTEDSYIGYHIANFRIKERIGRGGFGLVYLAEHLELGHEVAIKILRQQYTSDDQLVERFKREARVSSQIRHPNVVQISDFGFDPTIGFYYIMEYLAGISLADVMKSYTRGMHIERMLPILRQICAALDVAHSHNVVHRDLKPSNIFLVEMFGQSDFVKILDFGIAKVLQGEEGQGVTATGQIVGSPRFMSPEQARGRHHEVDQRSDIYALGVMIFWMLTGRLPFESKQLARLLFMHIKTPPPTLNSVRSAPHFTPALEAIVAAALAKEKEARPSTAGELYRLLEQACQNTPVEAVSIDPFGVDPEDRTVRVVLPARPALGVSDMIPSAMPDTPSGVEALQEITSELHTIDSSATRSLQQPISLHEDGDDEERTQIDNIDRVHKILDERETTPALAFSLPQAVLTGAAVGRASTATSEPGGGRHSSPFPGGIPGSSAVSASKDRMGYSDSDPAMSYSTPPILARTPQPSGVQGSLAGSLSSPVQGRVPVPPSPVVASPKNAIQRTPTTRWKTILLTTLTLILLGEILFLGWRWWQRQQSSVTPVKRSATGPSLNPQGMRPFLNQGRMLNNERNG